MSWLVGLRSVLPLKKLYFDHVSDDAYTEDTGSWTGNKITSYLTIDNSLITDVIAITCKVSFEDDTVTDPISTSTQVNIRGKALLIKHLLF